MLFLEQNTKNNFLSHRLTRNPTNTFRANLLVARRLGNKKSVFNSRSPLFSLIKKFSSTKTKYSKTKIFKYNL